MKNEKQRDFGLGFKCFLKRSTTNGWWQSWTLFIIFHSIRPLFNARVTHQKHEPLKMIDRITSTSERSAFAIVIKGPLKAQNARTLGSRIVSANRPEFRLLIVVPPSPTGTLGRFVGFDRLKNDINFQLRNPSREIRLRKLHCLRASRGSFLFWRDYPFNVLFPSRSIGPQRICHIVLQLVRVFVESSVRTAEASHFNVRLRTRSWSSGRKQK